MPERLFVFVMMLGFAFGSLVGGNLPAFLSFLICMGLYAIFIGVRG
jgi:hypothetical protein